MTLMEDKDSDTKKGFTAMHYAALFEHTDVLKNLFLKGMIYDSRYSI